MVRPGLYTRIKADRLGNLRFFLTGQTLTESNERPSAKIPGLATGPTLRFAIGILYNAKISADVAIPSNKKACWIQKVVKNFELVAKTFGKIAKPSEKIDAQFGPVAKKSVDFSIRFQKEVFFFGKKVIRERKSDARTI